MTTASRRTSLLTLIVTFLSSAPAASRADDDRLEADVRTRASAVEQKVIEWRRDIHQHPELADQESRTSRKVAEHLKALGLEVRTGVARTGVVGVLRGA